MTDINLLRALLGSKRLTGSQEKAFKGMLQDLVDGKLVSLTKGQKDWVVKVVADLNLEGKPVTLAPLPKPRKQVGGPPSIFDQPLPKKPPGRS